MKNLSLILNVVLLLAVGYLYVDKFSSKKAAASPQVAADTLVNAGARVVYINADTLLEKYDYFKKKTEDLEKRKNEADASLKARGRALEKEAMELAQKAQTGNMTRKELEDADAKLGGKQQRLLSDQENIAASLLKESDMLNEELQKELKSKLDSLKTQMGYDFILSYGTGSPVLMVNDKLDVTQKVLEMLNQAKKQ